MGIRIFEEELEQMTMLTYVIDLQSYWLRLGVVGIRDKPATLLKLGLRVVVGTCFIVYAVCESCWWGAIYRAGREVDGRMDNNRITLSRHQGCKIIKAPTASK